MPRPVLARLGLNYRRLPLLAVGRDIYCNPRCIIQTLEERYPSSSLPRLGVDPKLHPYEQAIEKVLEVWALELLFGKTTDTIPFDQFLARGPKWIEDRRQFSGQKLTKEGMQERLPEMLVAARIDLDLVETLLADGRNWDCGGKSWPRGHSCRSGFRLDVEGSGFEHETCAPETTQ